MRNKSLKSKSGMHPRNPHKTSYDFKKLCLSNPELKSHVIDNGHGQLSINFSNPQSVLLLNKSLLMHFYDISFWEIPEQYLCPPIPGRADYIHNLADLLAMDNSNCYPVGNCISALDIGTGANCIYPIIGQKEYGWNFVGSDIDKVSVNNAKKIVVKNSHLNSSVEIRRQIDKNAIFSGVISNNEAFDITLCNPPFHMSAKEARAGSLRKVKNLTRKAVKQPVLNFGGQNNELWCEGGELAFISRLIRESLQFKDQVYYFTSLVSKSSNLSPITKLLKELKVEQHKVIEMAQGQKKSRLVAWTFLNSSQRLLWRNERWKEVKRK